MKVVIVEETYQISLIWSCDTSTSYLCAEVWHRHVKLWLIEEPSHELVIVSAWKLTLLTVSNAYRSQTWDWALIDYQLSGVYNSHIHEVRFWLLSFHCLWVVSRNILIQKMSYNLSSKLFPCYYNFSFLQCFAQLAFRIVFHIFLDTKLMLQNSGDNWEYS